MSVRANERLCGILLIGLLVALVIWRPTAGSVETDIEGFRSSLNDLLEERQRFLMGLAVLIVASACAISLAGPLYLAFRDHDRTLGLVGAFALAGLAATLAGMFMAGFALDQLAQTTPQDVASETVARATALVMKGGRDAAFGAFLPLSLLAFGGAIIRAAPLPRWLGWLAVVSAALNLFFWLDPISEGLGAVGRIGVVGAWLWLFVTGIWMLRRGTKEASNEE